MSLRRLLQLTLAVLVAAGLWATASPAGAVDNPDYTSPPPSTVITTPPPTTPPAQSAEVETAVQVAPVRTRLAITGSDATGAVVAGTTLILIGAGVLALRRRGVPAS